MNSRQTVLRGIQVVSVLALAISLTGCPSGDSTSGGSTGTPTPNPAFGLRLQQIATGLSFPVFATAPNDGSGRLFIVEKGGAIKILILATGQVLATPFLNIASQISTAGEQGLLGLAFHPNYSTNGFFYVNIVTPAGFTEIRRYQTMSLNPNVADPASATLIIRIDQRLPNNGGLFTNHKAGWLGFGQDGFLYAALGDGGSGGDPQNVAQNPDILLGKMLRLNVDFDAFADPDRNYSIPAGNPFALTAGADEIWALGLRNPWRASFDRGTGDLYIADVGQGAREEVNVATAASGGGNGINYGWKNMEGTNCFFLPCNLPAHTPPVLEYDSSGSACSITGGYVYRGNIISMLQGTYFYADYCLGFVRSFRLINGVATEQTDWATLAPPAEQITSFGEDAAGELYIVTQQGRIYRIAPN